METAQQQLQVEVIIFSLDLVLYIRDIGAEIKDHVKVSIQ